MVGYIYIFHCDFIIIEIHTIKKLRELSHGDVIQSAYQLCDPDHPRSGPYTIQDDAANLMRYLTHSNF